MSRIRLLDDHLVSQIAAGEVVERPASVVKELIENALDSGASEVAVELAAGGKRRVVVTDDGSGMDGDDALLAFDRHATSKIATFGDLERVATLGFRGEALASIAAVSRVELRSAQEAGEGTRVRIEGGRVKSVEPVAHPRGTRLEIASLFFNVPARRKFLKRPETELRRSIEVVQGYALAHPEVRFAVDHDGRRLLDAPPAGPGSEGLRQRIAQIFGRDLSDHLAEIGPLPEPLEEGAEEARETIAGFVGDPETTRGRRLFVYVNRRLVRDRAILARFYRAVRETWKSESYPALFLFLELDAAEVDVNVHPQKAEVRFRDPGFIDRVEAALRRALEDARGEVAAPFRPARDRPQIPAAWEGLGSRHGQPAAPRHEPRYDGSWEPQRSEVREDAPVFGGPHTEERLREAERRAEGSPERIAEPVTAPIEPRTVPLSGRSGEPRRFRILGQYKGSLILLEGPDGLYLIDQHVAHERILYERLRRSLGEERPASQALVEPILLELGPSERMRLEELAPALEGCGYEVAVLSGNTVAMKAVPVELEIGEAERVLRDLASGSGESDAEAEDLERRLLEALAANLSCRAAVKMHRPLGPEQMEALVSELFRAENPYACPHGRPVVLKMGDAELERHFGRR